MAELAVDQFNKRVVLVFYDANGDRVNLPAGGTVTFNTSDPMVLRVQPDPESQFAYQLLPVAEGVATISATIVDGLGNPFTDDNGDVIEIDDVHIVVGPGGADRASISISDDPPGDVPAHPGAADPNAPGAPLPGPSTAAAPLPTPVVDATTSGAPHTGMTMYQHVGSSAIDASAWEAVPDVTTSDLQPLYMFKGDTKPGDATGASIDWNVYTGQVIAAPASTSSPVGGSAPTPPPEQTSSASGATALATGAEGASPVQPASQPASPEQSPPASDSGASTPPESAPAEVSPPPQSSPVPPGQTETVGGVAPAATPPPEQTGPPNAAGVGSDTTTAAQDGGVPPETGSVTTIPTTPPVPGQ